MNIFEKKTKELFEGGVVIHMEDGSVLFDIDADYIDAIYYDGQIVRVEVNDGDRPFIISIERITPDKEHPSVVKLKLEDDEHEYWIDKKER